MYIISWHCESYDSGELMTNAMRRFIFRAKVCRSSGFILVLMDGRTNDRSWVCIKLAVTCYRLRCSRIGTSLAFVYQALAISDEIFKFLDGRTTMHGYIISSPCELNDSGEHLKCLDGRTTVHGYLLLAHFVS